MTMFFDLYNFELEFQIYNNMLEYFRELLLPIRFTTIHNLLATSLKLLKDPRIRAKAVIPQFEYPSSGLPPL